MTEVNMDEAFDGLSMGLGTLARLSGATSRSISAENLDGGKGCGGMATTGEGADAARALGRAWKVSPCIRIPGSATVSLADIQGPGAIQHIWMTVDPALWRRLVLRFYWDDESSPSIELPVGDFFCNGWGVRCNIASLAVAVNPAGGFNCYWEMPFRSHARISVENLSPDEAFGFFYQIDYTLTEVPADRAYFHAQWRRSNPVKSMEVHTLLDGVRGQGQYVGTYLAMGVQGTDWWGEGEIKFYMDGDTDWPTICGTGTEDYFGGAWGFESPEGKYGAFSTPFLGLPQVILPDSRHLSRQRFGLYRWHIMDPIRFKHDLRVTLQDLGYHLTEEGKGKYVTRQDDIASTVFWYQTEPHAHFPALPGNKDLEVT
jgi:hypothetical protein